MKGIQQLAIWRQTNLQQPQLDWLAQEVAVALVYNGISHVVMMATPKELDVFAIGFSLTEGIINSLNDIYAIEIVENALGIEVQLEIATRCFVALKERRRSLTGRTGCGLCGSEQLQSIYRPLSSLSITQQVKMADIDSALLQLRAHQPLAKLTGGMHAVAYFDQQGQFIACCEDIGRHVALDKLLGSRAKSSWPAGMVMITSRASYEMVQKVISCGIEILVAVSAATTLAVTIAQRHRLTLIGFCQPGRVTVYSYPERLLTK